MEWDGLWGPFPPKPFQDSNLGSILHRQQCCLALASAILQIPGKYKFCGSLLRTLQSSDVTGRAGRSQHNVFCWPGSGHTPCGSSRLSTLSVPCSQAGRHRDNCRDIFFCRSIVQNRGIFAVLPAEVPVLLDHFFPRTVFNLILLYILVFLLGRGAGKHSRKAPCRVIRDFSLQSALLSTYALPFCHLILSGPDPRVQGWQSCCCMWQCTRRSSVQCHIVTAKIGTSCKCLYGKTLKMFFFFQKISGFFPD